MKHIFRVILFIATVLIFSSCGHQSLVDRSTQATESKQQVNNEEKLPGRYQLYRAYSNHNIMVVYNGKDMDFQNHFKSLTSNLITNLTKEDRAQFNISFKLANEVIASELSDQIIYMVGSSPDQSIIKKLSERIPFTLVEDSFNFDKESFTADDAVIAIHNYPNPNHQSLPLTIITGNDEQAIMKVFERSLSKGINFLWQSFDYIIYKQTYMETVGSFDRQWQYQEDQRFDFDPFTEPNVSNSYVNIYSQNEELPKEELTILGESIATKISSIQQFVGSRRNLPTVNYYIYSTAESKALQQGNSTQAHFDANLNSVYTIINEKYKDNYIEKENQLVIRQLLRQPFNEILELGLSIRFTDKWQKYGFEYWAARLASSDNTLSLIELTNQESMQYESPLVKECMAGALVNFLIDKKGKDVFLKEYIEWNPTKDELGQMESNWQAYLITLAKQHPRKEIRLNTDLGLKGFNFAHEGYRIFNGYMSNLATQSIEKQVSLGCNALAIVPYSYMRDDQKPTPLPITNRPGSENDQGVIHSAYEAKARGMTTMLKPQIWLRGSWPGGIKMKSDADWQLFYKHYHKWIRHYALLAEIHEIDMLCVGVEFVNSTLAHEDEWRDIFQNLRGLYSGQLTYAANWGDEFEKVQFWDELDFIGLNCYYPLSKKDNATKAELSENFEKVKRKIQKVYDRHQKPIVFTEIGFRSINAPWMHPHAEGDNSFNEKHQEICYKVVLEGVENEEWYGGILWWKFPSYLRYGGDKNNSYTPNNKLAENTVNLWFSEKAEN